MQTFIDTNSPRHTLRFEQLPRGFVPFPEHIVQGIARQKAERGYGDEYARASVVRHTLVWFYDGLPVAYRERPDGIDVLALGWEETAKYELAPQKGVKVVQP